MKFVEAQPCDRRRLALVVTAVGAASVFAVVWWLFGGVIGERAGATGKPRAALAFRDHVPAYQELVSANFSRALFADRYDRFVYITQDRLGNTESYREALTDLLSHYQEVDLFLLAHSNHLGYEVAQIDPALTQNLRLVYNTGCHNAEQGPLWLSLGADAYVGHAAPRSISPVFFLFFARLWHSGENLGRAVALASDMASARLSLFGLSGGEFSTDGTLFGDAELRIGGR